MIKYTIREQAAKARRKVIVSMYEAISDAEDIDDAIMTASKVLRLNLRIVSEWVDLGIIEPDEGSELDDISTNEYNFWCRTLQERADAGRRRWL